MTQTAKIIEFSQKNDIETTLVRMKKLKAKITELTAEFDMLKKEAIEGYFSEHDTYMTAKGLVLATYKEIISNRFDSTAFKKVHPSLYADFTNPQSSYRFDIK